MINVIDKTLSEASQMYNLSSLKIKTIMEAAERELHINYNEAELKVIKESGTDDDLKFLYEAADKEFKDVTLKAIKKRRDVCDKFFSKMKDRIIKNLSDKDTKEVINKISKKAKLYPLLNKKKLLVENYNAEIKLRTKALAGLNKIRASIGSAEKDTVLEAIADVEKEFDIEHNATLGVSAAVPITINKAVNLVNSMIDDASKTITDNKKLCEKYLNEAESMIKSGADPSTVNAWLDCALTFIETSQEDYMRCLSGTLKQIKGSIHSFSKAQKDITTDLKENAEDTDDMSNDNQNDKPKELKPTDLNEDSSNDDPMDSYVSNKEEDLTADGFDAVCSMSDSELDEDDIEQLEDLTESEKRSILMNIKESAEAGDDVSELLEAVLSVYEYTFNKSITESSDDDDDDDEYNDDTDYYESSNNTPTLESVYEELFNESYPGTDSDNSNIDTHVGKKPSNEKILKDIYDLIGGSKSVTESTFDTLLRQVNELTGNECVEESAYDKLLSQINTLF